MNSTQVWWKGDAPVVVGNNDLKRGVIQSFHNPPTMGHPGIANTYTLMRRDYWWPNMKSDVEEFVKGCASCQEKKINTHCQKPHLYPITTNPNVLRMGPHKTDKQQSASKRQAQKNGSRA